MKRIKFTYGEGTAQIGVELEILENNLINVTTNTVLNDTWYEECTPKEMFAHIQRDSWLNEHLSKQFPECAKKETE